MKSVEQSSGPEEPAGPEDANRGGGAKEPETKPAVRERDAGASSASSGNATSLLRRLAAALEAQEKLEAELLPDTVQLAIAAGGALLVGLLYLILPATLTPGPNWLPLLLEAILLAPSLFTALLLESRLPYYLARGLALALLVLLTLALITSVVLLVHNIPNETGANLLRDGAVLWVINILVFAVWYWEIDGEGPLTRLQAPYLSSDFQFPQQVNGNPSRWVPGFVDYLFLAFCFATALSPADTPPFTRRGKALMMLQASISLTIIVLLVARSVNILPMQ